VKFDIPHLSLGSSFDLSLLECKLPLSELVKAAPRSLFQKYHLQNNPLVADITNVILFVYKCYGLRAFKFFSDEAWFHLPGYVNSQNFKIDMFLSFKISPWSGVDTFYAIIYFCHLLFVTVF
jgi:hypothetical protein